MDFLNLVLCPFRYLVKFPVAIFTGWAPSRYGDYLNKSNTTHNLLSPVTVFLSQSFIFRFNPITIELITTQFLFYPIFIEHMFYLILSQNTTPFTRPTPLNSHDLFSLECPSTVTVTLSRFTDHKYK